MAIFDVAEYGNFSIIKLIVLITMVKLILQNSINFDNYPSKSIDFS
jgi:hypothetical protein